MVSVRDVHASPNGNAAYLPDSPHNAHAESMEPPRRFKFWSIEEMLAQLKPTYLYEPYVVGGEASLLFAGIGKGKTFLVVEIACRVAVTTGRPVVIVMAEGNVRKFGDRLYAWCATYNGGKTIPNLVVITQPVYVAIAEELAVLQGTLADAGLQRPALFALDTVSRCNLGDENSTKDMQDLIRGVDILRRETGAHVMLVHHSGWAESDRMRGSTGAGRRDAVHQTGSRRTGHNHRVMGCREQFAPVPEPLLPPEGIHGPGARRQDSRAGSERPRRRGPDEDGVFR